MKNMKPYDLTLVFIEEKRHSGIFLKKIQAQVA